jgi:phthalate 4,5-cis-dihydrodiol dehydrogenase
MEQLLQRGASMGKLRGHLSFGVAGLGVGASSILPALATSPHSALGAGADIDPNVRRRFGEIFPQARVFETVAEMCGETSLDAIWVSSPNRFHAEHAILAAEAGKHVIISKPMATSLSEAEKIIIACQRSGVKLIAGHSLGFSPAIRTMAHYSQPEGKLGSLRAIQLFAFTDWMVLPRTAEDIDPALGGGFVQRQSSHQIDTLRLLGGGMVRSVRAHVGQWMPERKGPGFFTAFLQFENGVVGTASHNGYGHLVGSEIVKWGDDVGISGRDIVARAAARKALRDKERDEDALKDSMRLGGAAPLFRSSSERKPWLPMHLGLVIASCERGDMRHSPYGIYVYDDEGRSEIPVFDDGSWFGLSEVEELYEAAVHGTALFRDGEWGMATLEIALAIPESSRLQKEIVLTHQVPVRAGVLRAPSKSEALTQQQA